MKYSNEFRDKRLANLVIKQIKKNSKKKVSLMEVCGGHTMAIRKYGIQDLLPSSIQLISGPGCPVCVTSKSFIDKIIEYSKLKNNIITTYGDLIRIPGSTSSLLLEKAKGADIRIIYSTLEAIKLAKEYVDKKVIFPAIGFETTTPATAVAIMEAEKLELKNFLIVSAHKTMPNALISLLESDSIIDGFIGPGHVSTIAGAKIYTDIVNKYNIPVTVSGFEPLDILHSILMLVNNIEKSQAKLDIQYARAVSYDGNLKAQQLVDTYFEPVSAFWRGIGIIPKSGLKLRKAYQHFDAENVFPIDIKETKTPKECLCGNILRGLNQPTDCKLFGKTCTPENPVGACMVSSEGSCAAYYKFSRE